ncbi:MAG: MFS transporter [Legionellales bacterium]|nr:MFS transporter [Legionellales bacterium]
MNKRLLIVFVLGFSSGLPLALLTSTLQAWFADSGLSIFFTASLSLLGFPYVYRVLWAPFLDRYALFSLGKRRSWMLVMQVLLMIGFQAMAWLSPLSSPKLIAGLAFVLACCSATQDAAIDAHRTEYLPESEHGLGASLAVFGYRLALLIAGGLALIIAQYWGWAFAYRAMGFLMLFGMVATLYSPEPSVQSVHPLRFADELIAPAKELLSRPGIIVLLCFVFFYKLGEAFTTTTSGIVMPFLIQGVGFPLDTIAYVNKMMGISAIVIGGLVAGVVLLRCSLFSALLWFGLLQASTNVLFILLAMVGKSLPLLAIAVVSDNFASGMGSTAVVALYMRLVDKRYTATQFSMFVAVATLPRILSGPMAAWFQSWAGWVGLYQWSSVLALGFIPFLMMLRKQTMLSSPLIMAKVTRF